MNRPLLAAFVVGAVAAGMAGPRLAAAEVSEHTLKLEAPADAYFGPFKMSTVGIRNEINTLASDYHERSKDDTDIVHDAKLAEAALYAWQKKYPDDPLIPKALFHLEQLYQGVQSTNARTHAIAVLHFIAAKYPKSEQAHFARLRLKQGFPPLHAESAIKPTPSPLEREEQMKASEQGASPSASLTPAAGTAGASAAPGTSAAPSSAPSGAPATAAPTAAPPTSGSPMPTTSPL